MNMTTATITTDRIADRLDKQADTLADKIKKLRAPRLENTPKRQREGMTARGEAEQLAEYERALRIIAAARRGGTLPMNFQWIGTRADIEDLLRREWHSSGYYHNSITKNYRDQSGRARDLRAWLEDQESPEQKAQKQERAKLDRIAAMEQAVRFSDIPGFFPTPPAVIARMLELAQIEPGMSVLDPSAGKGDILDAVKRAEPTAQVVGIEINHALATIINAKGHAVLLDDAMNIRGRPEDDRADRVLMNPPFERKQDQQHVMHAYVSLLKRGGRLVAVVPTPTANEEGSPWANWFADVGGWAVALPAGSFAGRDAFRQTGVSTCLIVIDKPE